MPYTTSARHIGSPNRDQRVARTWSPNRSETVDWTASRRTAPRAWMTALQAAYQAKLIPSANGTTLRVAADLAARMDFGTGHVRYCWERVMHATQLARRSVARHVAILRSAGWLAWLEHGTRTNSRTAKGEAGYAGTATVYAATIPPVYDRHVGNRVHGSGYTARVVGVTSEGRDAQVTQAQDRAAAKATCTPSPRVVKEEGSVQVVGGSSTATRPTNSKPRTTILGNRVTRDMIVAAKRAARFLRPLVNWTQGATLRQLSWALLDLAARGWDEHRMLGWLREITCLMRTGWRPVRPHRFIATTLRVEAAQEAAYCARTAPETAAPTVGRLPRQRPADGTAMVGEDYQLTGEDRAAFEEQRVRILMAARHGTVADAEEAAQQVRMWAALLGVPAARAAFGDFADVCLAA